MKYKRLKIIIISFLLIFCLSGPSYARNLGDAFKVDNSTVVDPLDAAGGTAGYNIERKTDRVFSIISTVIQLGLSLLGIAFILLIIYGGFLWMSDQGNEEQVKRARNLIISAVIGLVIVVSAYAISWFIVNVFSQAALEPPEISNQAE